jgi:signal peptidase I
MEVSTRELMPLIYSALQRGQCVRLTVKGGSMRPFIRSGDVVELEPVDCLVRVGDVVLLRCGSGEEGYVLHRVVRVQGEKIFIRGDAQEISDGPFAQGDVLGRVTTTYCNGRLRQLDSNIWRLLGLAWHRLVPLNVWLLRFALQFRRDQ